jgi:hypothetical protein
MKFAHLRLWEALVKTHKYLYILAIVCIIYTVFMGVNEHLPQPTVGKFHSIDPLLSIFPAENFGRHSRRSIGEHMLIYSIQHISSFTVVYYWG